MEEGGKLRTTVSITERTEVIEMTANGIERVHYRGRRGEKRSHEVKFRLFATNATFSLQIFVSTHTFKQDYTYLYHHHHHTQYTGIDTLISIT